MSASHKPASLQGFLGLLRCRAQPPNPRRRTGERRNRVGGANRRHRPCRHGRSWRSAALRREPVSSLRRPYNEEDQGPCKSATPRDLRVVYDHEDHVDAGAEPVPDDARDAVTVHEDSRGRRREIADWGGDELFGGRVARRRFTRTGPRPEGARGAAARQRRHGPSPGRALERPLLAGRRAARRPGAVRGGAHRRRPDRRRPTDDAASGPVPPPGAPRRGRDAHGRRRRRPVPPPRAPRARETRGRHARTPPRPGGRPQRGRPRPDPRRRPAHRAHRLPTRSSRRRHPRRADPAPAPAAPRARARRRQPRPARGVGVRARPRAHPDRRRHGRRLG